METLELYISDFKKIGVGKGADMSAKALTIASGRKTLRMSAPLIQTAPLVDGYYVCFGLQKFRRC